MSSSMVSSTERSLSANTMTSESEGTELLHWKKGNLLGKGAFGTVSSISSLRLSLKLYYQNKQTIITEYTIVASLVKGDHKIAN